MININIFLLIIFQLNNSQNKNKKNHGYTSFYNDKSLYNKAFKNKITSERINNTEFKTILNPNNENLGNEIDLIDYKNKNNTYLDQQILDYLNKNYEEKKNLIKRMRNQKLMLNKSISSKKSLNNNKKKIVNLNNLNNLNSYSYINNNYNYYVCNQNQNSTLNNLNNSNNDRISFNNDISMPKKNSYQNMK